MPRNATTGVFTLLENANYPAVSGTKITSSAHNAQMEDMESALNSEPFTQASGGGVVARSTAERARERMSILDFVEDPDERAAILAGTSTYDSTTALQDAIDWANADVTIREIEIPGGVVIDSDVTDLFDVQLVGPGYIKLGTGAKWFVEPNLRNTGFTPLTRNTIYVSKAIGNDNASGLSPAFPVLTLQAAIDRFESIRDGFCRISIVDGVFRETSTFNQVSSSRSAQFDIQGPSVSTWNNTTPPTKPVAITAITSANPAVITAAGHGRSVGEKVMVYDAVAAASAEHGSVAQIFTITAVAGNDITVNVDGSGWAAYVGSGKLIDMNGSSPQAVFFGSKSTTDWAISQDSDDYVTYANLMFVNWGTKTLAQNAGGILASSFGTATLQNIHAYGCSNRCQIRTFSVGDTSAGGYIYGCGTGDWSITGRSTFGGPANPGSAALTTTGLYHECIYPVALWEGAEAHFDGAIVKDCTNIAYVSGAGSHLVSYYMNFVNTTGSPLGGYIVEHGGNLTRSNGKTDVITGAFAPIVSRRDATLNYSSETRNVWNSVYTRQLVLTPGSGQQTVLTTPILQYEMNTSPQGFRAELWGIGTNATDTIIIRVKLDSTVVYSRTESTDPSAREMRWVFEAHANGFDAVRLTFQGQQLIGSTTTNRFDISSPAFVTSGGNQTLTVTVEVTSASDSMNMIYNTMDKFGC